MHKNLGPEFLDGFGRNINYLRLSVTDRCNLQCFYCKGRKDYKHISHADILRYEECLSLIRAARQLGVHKVRLTGGEPFIRKDFEYFLEQIFQNFPEIDLRVTTNGTLLKGRISRLKEIGLNHLNISLDTLEREKFIRITGKDCFLSVRDGIAECLDKGIKVKVNVVAMQGVNDDELNEFVELAKNNDLDLRFIEFMPIGNDSSWEEKLFCSADEIKKRIQEMTPLEPVEQKEIRSGPARMYSLPQGVGRIGVISPLSNHFCEFCNRFRITSHGRLRTCLFSDKEYNLLSVLRNPKCKQGHLLKVMQKAVQKKPMGYELYKSNHSQNSLCSGQMSYIGG